MPLVPLKYFRLCLVWFAKFHVSSSSDLLISRSQIAKYVNMSTVRHKTVDGRVRLNYIVRTNPSAPDTAILIIQTSIGDVKLWENALNSCPMALDDTNGRYHNRNSLQNVKETIKHTIVLKEYIKRNAQNYSLPSCTL